MFRNIFLLLCGLGGFILGYTLLSPDREMFSLFPLAIVMIIVSAWAAKMNIEWIKQTNLEIAERDKNALLKQED